MKLRRTDFLARGIFGELTLDDGSILFSLEKSYPLLLDGQTGSRTWAPRMPSGPYLARRKNHVFFGMQRTIDTFELVDRTLFHPGDPNTDVENCIVLGLSRGNETVLNTQRAFAKFMTSLWGSTSFELEIQ